MKHVVTFSHQLMQETLYEGDTVIDATCGNGNDTLFLSSQVGESGRVLAFDIQYEAVEATRRKVSEHKITNTRIFQHSHENVDQFLAENEKIGGAVFNLGYLPGSDKTIITKGVTTVQAIETLLFFLRERGVIVLVIYHGHTGGREEKEAILHYVTLLDQKHFSVLQYGYINQRNDPPFIIAIEKR